MPLVVETHHCSCNWTESSKTMEPNGIFDYAKQIWDCGDWMKTFISNDNSSSRCALHHPIPMPIEKGYINEWPQDKKGKPVKSHGKLPVEINAVLTYLVNPSHWHCVYGANLFKLDKDLKQMKKTYVSV